MFSLLVIGKKIDRNKPKREKKSENVVKNYQNQITSSVQERKEV